MTSANNFLFMDIHSTYTKTATEWKSQIWIDYLFNLDDYWGLKWTN